MLGRAGFLAALSACVTASGLAQLPGFGQYPATDTLHGPPRLPRITNEEERRFRTVLRQGVTKGYSVVEGGTEDERCGPNFGGYFYLVQWGCGSNCSEAALVNGRTGRVLRMPHVPGSEPEHGFEVPVDVPDLRSLRFRTDSRLLGVPYVGDARTYYFVLARERWRFSTSVPTVPFTVGPSKPWHCDQSGAVPK